MRPSLRHQIGERRRTHRTRGTHRPDPAPEAAAAALETDLAARELHAAVPEALAAAQVPDIAARRVREAGGPSDQASYVCQCGYLFAAAVSTTVECPHCGTSQAW